MILLVLLALLVHGGGRAAQHPCELDADVWSKPGSVVIGIGQLSTGSTSCALRSPVHIRLDEGGRTLRFPGNPVNWRPRGVLGPWGYTLHTWTWRHPCGGTVRVTASAGGAFLLSRLPSFANCRKGFRAALIDSGSLLPPRLDRIPATIFGPDPPGPLSPELIRVQNGWMTSDGITLVALYAGESGGNPQEGLIVVIRQNLLFGSQSVDSVVAGESGAVHIVSAPTGKAAETTGQHADVHFQSTSGSSGILHLTDDTLTAT